MRRQIALTGMTMLMLGALAGAQETSTGDRVVVPARGSSRPRLVKASLRNGSITVKAYNGKEVIVETRGGDSRRRAGQTRDGLRRIDIPSGGLEVTEEDNVVTVRMATNRDETLVISVPADTSLQLQSTNGGIDVDGVRGEIDVSSHNDNVTLTNVSGTVVANSHNGDVKVALTRVDPGKPLSFVSYNGDLDVSLPADVKATLKVKSNRGDVFSDFDLRLTPGQAETEKSDSKDNRFRVRLDRTVAGTINGGGTDMVFTTYNGNIMIRKK